MTSPTTRLQHAPRPGVATIAAWSALTLMLFVAGDSSIHAASPSFGAGFNSSARPAAQLAYQPNQQGEASSDFVSGPSPGEVTGPFTGTNINTLLGAGAFYSQGYTGTNAVVANIEAGHIWNGHETLGHVTQITNTPAALNEFDRHATWVGMTIGGRQGGANPGVYQEGMAPGSQLYSGAFSAQWSGARYGLGFNFFFSGLFDQYRKAFSTGVNVAGRRADVVNSSWGGGDLTGTQLTAVGLDGLANSNPRTLFVNSAGNDGAGPDKVTSPASGYNDLTVAALRPSPTYLGPATFTSGGPNDYADPLNGTFNNARQVVDIAAPGQQLGSAYYGETTGGNGTTDNPAIGGTGPTGPANGIAGVSDFYTRGIAGTSFAAPTVAGGAALLYDAAYDVFPTNPNARDARVVKAVLMNSATKTLGWNNGQFPHPNGNGGVRTGQGLDNLVGTGRMNLQTAYDQYLTGTTDLPGTLSGNLGTIDALGWDFGQVNLGVTNDYYFSEGLAGGTTLTATLSWFRDRRLFANDTATDDSFDDLDLELWRIVGGAPAMLISESFSPFNSSEHFSFTVPRTGDYALRVRWFDDIFDLVGDANQELYGLAWSGTAVPEPGAIALFALGAVAITTAKNSRRRTRLRDRAQRYPISITVIPT